MKGRPSRRGFALVAVLLCLLLIGILGLTAASLALLARRSSRTALLTARAEAMAESDPYPGPLPIPPNAGESLVLSDPAADPGWSVVWLVTRLGGSIVLVQGTAELTGPNGVPLVRSTVARLAHCCDSLPSDPLPGGWLGAP